MLKIEQKKQNFIVVSVSFIRFLVNHIETTRNRLI